MKWRDQQISVLLELRNEYGENCWQKIAKELSKRIQNSHKTGRQCREKYFNCYKFNNQTKIDQDWSVQEEKQLYELYFQYGPLWSHFSQFFPNKSIGQLKNKFYNKIRKISRKVIQFQKINAKQLRNFITYQNILTTLELSSKLQNWVYENELKRKQNSKIFQTKEIISKLIFFSEEQFDEILMGKLVENLKYINKQLRCLGIFRIKFKKQWRLSEDRLNFILRSDNIIEDIQQTKSASSIKGLRQTNSQNSQKSQQYQYFNEQYDIESLNLEQQIRFATSINNKQFNIQQFDDSLFNFLDNSSLQ